MSLCVLWTILIVFGSFFYGFCLLVSTVLFGYPPSIEQYAQLTRFTHYPHILHQFQSEHFYSDEYLFSGRSCSSLDRMNDYELYITNHASFIELHTQYQMVGNQSDVVAFYINGLPVDLSSEHNSALWHVFPGKWRKSDSTDLKLISMYLDFFWSMGSVDSVCPNVWNSTSTEQLYRLFHHMIHTLDVDSHPPI